MSQSSPRLSPGPIPPAGPGKHHRHRAGRGIGAANPPGDRNCTADRNQRGVRSSAGLTTGPGLGSTPGFGVAPAFWSSPGVGAAAGVGVAPGFRSCPGARSPECRLPAAGQGPAPSAGRRLAGPVRPRPRARPIGRGGSGVTASSRFCAPPHRAPAERCRAEPSGSEPRQPLGPDVVTPAPGGRACPSAGDPGKSVRPHPHFPRALALSLCE